MQTVELIKPNQEFLPQIARFKDTYDANHIPGSGMLMGYSDLEEWLSVIKQHEDPNTTPQDRVASHTYLLVEEAEVIGMLDIRMELNEYLYTRGGHIGYAITPEKRGQGYGKKMLSLGINEAYDLGIDRLLITCDQDNLASQHVIKANGGKLANHYFDRQEEKWVQRYTI